ncbi:potassium channel family protein [Psychromonas ossibalaenae]|uniref:potassium channel family protein n=1 Tax=Psychromonas ossibalaenae TaxID=444922 RepID=UPI0003775D0C|nr:potassium channel family protein [Psychromonas ossibalaenae]
MMFLPIRIKKHLRRLTRQLTWPMMFILVLAQAGITYLLFVLAGETELTRNPLQFLYYNMVVISTVGFGDFSPATHLGKIIVSAFQIPSGLIIFATFIGKITQLFINIARSNMIGTNDFYHYDDHILLLCWNKHSTEQIIKLILGDKKRKKRQILLCVTDDMKNPFPDSSEISFVRLRTFSDTEELQRIALSKAKRIIVDGRSDDETLSIALSIATYASPDANISAHFFDKSKAELLKIHCPQIECSVDTSSQMMVRSMQDPGSSQVAEQLLSTLSGATLYSIKTPELIKPLSFGLLFNQLKSNNGMIVIGLSHFKNGDKMQLNPQANTLVHSADYLHYIADERVDASEINWSELY